MLTLSASVTLQASTEDPPGGTTEGVAVKLTTAGRGWTASSTCALAEPAEFEATRV